MVTNKTIPTKLSRNCGKLYQNPVNFASVREHQDKGDSDIQRQDACPRQLPAEAPPRANRVVADGGAVRYDPLLLSFARPERQARFLGLDEFQLHNGHRYATVIIDMETGHILWLSRGKKKECVFSFIDHVGEAWMDGVEAVCCDMNSDYQEAFEQRCCHIQVVFDYFHIKKNLNEKVIGAVRKDEQRRMIAEGDEEGAKLLKGSKYILTSSRETLRRKDEKAAGGKMADYAEFFLPFISAQCRTLVSESRLSFHS